MIQQPSSVWSFFFKMTRPFFPFFIVLLLVSLFWAFDVSFRPYLIKLMIDTIADTPKEHVLSELVKPGLCYAAMSLSTVLIYRLYDRIWIYISPALKHRIAQYAVSRLIRQSQRFYQNNFSGALTNKIKDLIANTLELLGLIIDEFIPLVFVLSVALRFLGTVNQEFAIGLFCWILIYTIGSSIFVRSGAHYSSRAAEYRSALSGYYVDLFNNIMAVRLFSGYRQEERILHDRVEDMVNAERCRDWFFLKLFFFQGATFVLYQSCSLYLLVQGVYRGWLTPGDFSLVLTVNIEILRNLWSFSRDISSFATSYGLIRQSLETINLDPEITDLPYAAPLQVSKGAIVCKDVCFGYRSNGYLFDKLTLTIPPLQKVGLVGFSGSGKTTFVNLLLRFYDLREGLIEIDGQDIKAVTQESLRDAIAFIPQESSLFHRSVKENIRYGSFQASDDEVEQAAHKAHAHDFIMNLSHGYDTEVGERGLRLSGGQRQRLSIARAVLKNAPILILDEATSQLDSLTEQEIQASLDELMNGKTTIVIAHRLSTLQKMDRILVFDNGKIVEDGSHQELLDHDGLYQQLWNAQMDGLLQSYDPHHEHELDREIEEQPQGDAKHE